jgi:hypothetical protein
MPTVWGALAKGILMINALAEKCFVFLTARPLHHSHSPEIVIPARN